MAVPIDIDGAEARIGASIGGLISDATGGEGAEALLAAADAALYAAKRAGRGCALLARVDAARPAGA